MKKPNVKSRIIRRVLAALCISFLWVSNVYSQSMADYMAGPPVEVTGAPTVMLVMSRDNQLWHKAYNDYSDISGPNGEPDGKLDTTYNDNFPYYGNFNSKWCYSYSNNMFVPTSLVDAPSHACLGADDWSGNFLNWMTTTRIDVVRRVLYGGLRDVDNSSSAASNANEVTVLQRALVPNDNHAFVKIVRNSDLEGGLTIANFTPLDYSGDDDAVSFCNVTDYITDHASKFMPSDSNSGIVDARPLFKVVEGSQRTWAGSEKAQCMFFGEEDAYSGRVTSTFSPSRTDMNGLVAGASNEFVVRVASCVEGKDAVDTSVCRRYVSSGGTVTYKPYGLLQQYGETGQLRFGLMTGSYSDNFDGAKLRKKVSFMGGADSTSQQREINPQTGQFYGYSENSSPGIIKTLNALRIAEWNYRALIYSDCNVLGLSVNELVYGSSGMTCRDWGNPIGDIYAEALRYLQTPVALSTSRNDSGTDMSVSNGMTLPVDTWPTTNSQDPFYGDGLCANCSIVVLSSGLTDFDVEINDISSTINATAIAAATDEIGVLENITPGAPGESVSNYLVGYSGSGSANDKVCTGKQISRLSQAHGSCPQAPENRSGFGVAGAAYLAHTTDIKPGAQFPDVQSVNTYAMSLSEPLPNFNIPIRTSSGEGSTRSISFVPTCHSSKDYGNLPAPYMDEGTLTEEWNPCSLVDLTVDVQNEVYGRFILSWEASMWGFDHDMDAYIAIEYCVNHAAIPTPTESPVPGATPSPIPVCEDYTTDYNTNYNEQRNISLRSDIYHRFEQMPQWFPDPSEPSLQIRISLLAASANSAMRFGYTISGAGENQDGVYDSQIIRYGLYDGVSSWLSEDSGSENFVIWDAGDGIAYKSANGNFQREDVTHHSNHGSGSPKYALRFIPGDDSPEYLKDPLWYAVKYGNFDDENGNGIPDDGEWDDDGDGNPDGYFPIKNPTKVKDSLGSILESILEATVSGTSASINMQTSSGEGAVYQALYTPKIHYDSQTSVTWAGSLYGLFFDGSKIREDRINLNDPECAAGRLDNRCDRVLEYESRDGNLEIVAYAVDANGEPDYDAGAEERFSITDPQFNPIWSAEEELVSQLESSEGAVIGAAADSTSVKLNRSSYSTNASDGRYIFTAINRDLDDSSHEYLLGPNSGVSIEIEAVNDGQSAPMPADVVFEFTRANFAMSKGDHRYLDLDGVVDQAEVNRLVDYIGGIEVEGFRSRTLPDGSRYVLGDIVNSNPVSVGKPNEAYGSEASYDDASYRTYLEAYRNRRNMVYVGGNDGMLHAFNAGFFNASNTSFSTSSGSSVEHPLGAELWAYIPFNLLPHLKWLANPGYRHVYFMDGPVQSFDVKLWPETGDSVHVGGWGTIIVAGMRLGGGDYSLDHDGLATTPDQILRSAYVVMDVTDPERPPELIAEIAHPDLGYTSSLPTVVKRNGGGDWYLVFGSGPRGDDSATKSRALVEGVSFSPFHLFSYDLKRGVLDAVGPYDQHAFTTGFTAADWNEDYNDDVVYFGTNARDPDNTTIEEESGNLKRAVVNTSGMGSLFSRVNNLLEASDVSKPFSGQPYVFKDLGTQERWIYAGTGRYLAQTDNITRMQQTFFGVKEPGNAQSGWAYLDSVETTDMFDTTFVETYVDPTIDVKDRTDGTIVQGGLPVSLSGVCASQTNTAVSVTTNSFNELKSYVQSECSGWYFDLFRQDLGQDRARVPGMRNILKPVASHSSLLISAFEPFATQCTVEANGYLYGPHRSVGVASPYGPLNIDMARPEANPENPEETEYMVIMGQDLGPGIPAITEVGVDSGPLEDGEDCHGRTALGQNSLGQILGVDINCEPFPAGRRGWAEIPVTW